MPAFWRGAGFLKLFVIGPSKSNKLSKHVSQRMVTGLRFWTQLNSRRLHIFAKNFRKVSYFLHHQIKRLFTNRRWTLIERDSRRRRNFAGSSLNLHETFKFSFSDAEIQKQIWLTWFPTMTEHSGDRLKSHKSLYFDDLVFIKNRFRTKIRRRRKPTKCT